MIYSVHTIMTDSNQFNAMCRKPYPNHPHGCPNYSKKQGCPPQSQDFGDVFDKDFYVIFTRFDLTSHVSRLRTKHKGWTRRQLYCCLYWQGTARKHLKDEIKKFQRLKPEHKITTCPEAMGVNVTALMKDNVGIDLEWPVETIAYQVAFAGKSLCEADCK